MTDPAPPTPDPALPPTAPAAPARPGPTRLQRTTALVATLGVAVALVGLLALLRPISTPTQDCGTSLAFLLDGRTNTFVDVDDPPRGVTREEAEANNARPCRDRVADAARPAVIAIAVGLVAAVAATIVEVVARGFAWRRRSRARAAAAAPPGAATGPT